MENVLATFWTSKMGVRFEGGIGVQKRGSDGGPKIEGVLGKSMSKKRPFLGVQNLHTIIYTPLFDHFWIRTRAGPAKPEKRVIFGPLFWTIFDPQKTTI